MFIILLPFIRKLLLSEHNYLSSLIQGILPEILEELLAARKRAKADLKVLTIFVAYFTPCITCLQEFHVWFYANPNFVIFCIALGI